MQEAGDREVAAAQAAYMYGKRYQAMHPDTTGAAPYYGVKSPGIKAVARDVRKRFPVATAGDYVTAVTALWAQPERENRYLAVSIASRHKRFVTFEHVPLYRRLITEGAWWDLVDGVAANCVGLVLLREREATRPLLERWVDDEDLWVRRTALLAHLTHKSETDRAQLFDHCRRRMHEKAFFIRKAIGWALRQYARTAPDAVRAFALQHREAMSGLTFREATKYLGIA
ncbi:MAG: DNA alkylation repair protein [Pseudomonadota bacterium]